MVSAEAYKCYGKGGYAHKFSFMNLQKSSDILCFSLPSSHIIIFQIEIILNI